MRKFKRCCCHHAPAVIILDIIIILILIGEIILIQERELELDNSIYMDTYKAPTFNYTFTYDNKTIFTNTSGTLTNNTTKNSTEPSTIKTSLWEVSASSVVIIPFNSFLIALGLRLLFCKMRVEFMKFALIGILFFLYITSMLGLTLYSSQGNTELFKQNFFLQYIILTISLVLGLLTETIALLMMAYYFMKVMQSQIKKVSHLFLLEQQELLMNKQQSELALHQENLQDEQQQQNAQQQNSQSINNVNNNSILSNRQQIQQQQQSLNNSVAGLVRALSQNTNQDQSMTNHNLIEQSQADMSANNLLSPHGLGLPSPNSRVQSRIHNNFQSTNIHNNLRSPLNNSQWNRQRSNRSHRSFRSPLNSGRRHVMNGLQEQLSQQHSSRSRESRQQNISMSIISRNNQSQNNRISINNHDRSNNSSFTFLDQRRSRYRQSNLFRSANHNLNRSGSNSQRSFSGSEHSSSQQLRCSICTLPLISNIVKMRTCDHIYHKNCLQQWGRITLDSLNINRSNNQQQCPLCNLNA